MAQAVRMDEERYMYAGTGTYGDALPRYAEPERVYEPGAVPSRPGIGVRPEIGRRTRTRESVGTQVSFPSIIGFIGIIALTVILIYNVVALFQEKAEVYSMGSGGMQTGLRAQLDKLKLEEEKLVAQFESSFGYDYVAGKAVELFDMLPGTAGGTTRQLTDKAEIPSTAYAAKPLDIIDRLLGRLG